jgi:hypothetical protein
MNDIPSAFNRFVQPEFLSQIGATSLFEFNDPLTSYSFIGLARQRKAVLHQCQEYRDH